MISISDFLRYQKRLRNQLTIIERIISDATKRGQVDQNDHEKAKQAAVTAQETALKMSKAFDRNSANPNERLDHKVYIQISEQVIPAQMQFHLGTIKNLKMQMERGY